MLSGVRKYLDDVRSHLHLDSPTEKQVIRELHSYFHEKITDLQSSGASEAEATKEAIKSCGQPAQVAQLTYEAYSQGSWSTAALASLPHLTVAALFAFHAWHEPFWAVLAFTVLVGTTLLGWLYGTPGWLYPWVGYSLAPLLVAGFISRPVLNQALSFILWHHGSLPNVWLLLLITTFIILSLGIIVHTTVKTVRRDWILTSLMLVPLPVLGSWLFNIDQAGGLSRNASFALHQWDQVIASTLIVLGVTSALFIRLRRRVVKAGALLVVGVTSLTVVIHNFWGDLGFFGILGTIFLSLIFLLIPAMLEARMGHGKPVEETWWSDEWIEHPYR